MRAIRSFFKNEPLRIAVGLVLFVPALVLDLLKIEVLPTILYILAMLAAGLPVFIDAVRGILRRDLLDEKFLMSIASIGAMFIGEMTEGAAVMLFFLVGEYFEHRATRAARGSIRSLMEICPDTATVLGEGGEEVVDSEDVEIGSTIIVKPGERVPIDAIILSGEAELDTSSLTGESVPRDVREGDLIESGAILIGASVTARTVRLAEDSRAARTLALVEEASDRKSREESFITSFSRYYTPIVTALALLMALVPSLLSLMPWDEALYRALSFLVVSCPCALVISVPMAFFGGIGGGAKRGILYKGGNVFAPVAYPECVLFDKTGTLTTGEFNLVGAFPVGYTEEELISLVAAAERNSTHPIARGICRGAPCELYPDSLKELPGRGVVAEIAGKTVAVGNASLMRQLGIEQNAPDESGAVLVAIDGRYAGYVLLKDSVKPEAASALADLCRLGVKRIYILSGDREASVRAVADELGVDGYFAELLPEDKYALLERTMEDGYRTLFVGDGINDAPCLARADVGVAMGERGSDSAIEAADLVVMTDRLDRIPEAVRSARRTVRIAKENIFLAIGVKLLALLLVGTGLVGMWMAVVADVGVAVAAILNSMRTLRGTSR